MSSNGNGLEAEVERLRAQLEDAHRISEPGFSVQVKRTATIARWVVGIVVACASVMGYVETRIGASAATERQLVSAEAVESSRLVAERTVSGAHLATREDAARQEQHLSDVDRRLFAIEQKIDALLARRR